MTNILIRRGRDIRDAGAQRKPREEAARGPPASQGEASEGTTHLHLGLGPPSLQNSDNINFCCLNPFPELKDYEGKHFKN